MVEFVTLPAMVTNSTLGRIIGTRKPLADSPQKQRAVKSANPALGTDDQRSVLLEDLTEQVPAVHVDRFFQLLPPLHKDINVDTVIQNLWTRNDILDITGTWRSFS